MLTLLGINKVLAIYVGPSGYAAIGQFQNAVQMISTIASGAINTGVTKFTAEYHDDEAKQIVVWRTAGAIALICSCVVSIIIITFNQLLAAWFLRDASLGSIFIWFAATLIFFVFNTLLLAILNGKKDLHRYVIANIIGSLFALVSTVFLTINFGVYGALVALAVYQSLAFFATLLIFHKAKWFKIKYLMGSIDVQAAKNLGQYTTMALTSAICAPLTNILIRNYLGEELGWEAVGYWEAMWRLSAAYLIFASSTLSVYYLPRLSELKNPEDIKKEILQGYKLILPVAAIFGLIIYFTREIIIRILFTQEFSQMESLFRWQMIGDTLKIGSWILAFLMLGKSMVKAYVFSEILFSGIFYFLVLLCVKFFQLKGVALAHAINYFLYWIVVAFLVRKNISKQ
jgi:PST family polysaccharide transporter